MNIAIYQVNVDRDQDGVCFCAMENLEEVQGTQNIHSSVYDKVFEGEVDCYSLEGVYRKFNLDRPLYFNGHALSVSDIVEIKDKSYEEPGFYYVDANDFFNVEFHPEETKEALPKTMDVVFVEPGCESRREMIGTELADLQRAVGGLIEVCTIEEDKVYLICNEEGKINGMSPNRALFDGDGDISDIIFGPFFICGAKGESFDSLPEDKMKEYTERFKNPEHFLVRNGNIEVVPVINNHDREEMSR